MKYLILLLWCISGIICDQQSEGSETSSISTKLSTSKNSINSIPSAPAQKTTLQQQSPQQREPQYIPQYYLPKQTQPPSQGHQPAAMFIIAQPAQQGSQSPVFQQAVHQLLSYYNNNPQAKYQLLQQQGGVTQQSHQGAVYQPQMPTGALRVINSPHLEQSNTHLSSQQPQTQTHQPTYVIPAQSQQILQGLGINPSIFNQLAQSQNQLPVPQHLVQTPQQIPIQFAQHQIPSFPAQSYSPQAQFLPQQFSQQFVPQYLAQPQYQAQIPTHLPSHFQFGNSGPAQAQFASKQVPQTEYQTEKSQQASSSSNYNPQYRTAYVKG